MNVRRQRAKSLFGPGQVVELRERMYRAAAAGVLEDGSSVLPAVDRREWRAHKLEGYEGEASPLMARAPPETADLRARARSSSPAVRIRRVFKSTVIADDENFDDDDDDETHEEAATTVRVLQEDDDMDAIPRPPSDSPTRAPLVVFVDVPSLRPSQQRNLQDAWGCVVYDRFSVVLNIFRSRARSKEALLRLELAKLGYERSRLVDSLAGLDQQRGGSSTVSGAGESN